MIISCCVDWERFTHKPTSEETATIQERMTDPVFIETSELLDLLIHGGNCRTSACMYGSGRDNFVSGQIFIIDCDNSSPGGVRYSKKPITPKQVREILQSHGIKVHFQYESWSNKIAPVPKFHTCVVINKPIYDREVYQALYKSIVNLLNDDLHVDTTVSKITQVIYGCGAGEAIYHDLSAVNDLTELLKYFGIDAPDDTPRTSPQKKEQRTARKHSGTSVNWEVIQAIQNHDADYLRTKISAPKTIVESKKELRNYIYHEIDFADFLEVDEGKKFCC